MQAIPVRLDLTSQIHAIIREAIISGELAPGEALAQMQLADQLGVSRHPVSHALKLLKAEGLVVDRGRKGQMVAPIDAERLLALYQVCGSLDRLAAQLAAKRVPEDSSTSQQLKQLIKHGTATAEHGDISSMVGVDVEFHRLLHKASGNSEIDSITEPLWPHLQRSMCTVLEDREYWKRVWHEHSDIADAVITGNADLAGNLAASHAEQAGSFTCQRLQQARSLEHAHE